MNVKIKANGVSCLIRDESYDKVYASLKQLLGDGEEQLFTPRLPGHEYLQWVLPNEGWCSLAEADPLMANYVREELSERKQKVVLAFGKNQMAQWVLSVPDDSYVYYKTDNEGRLHIRLTAWGYRYPERIGKKIITGVLPSQEDQQEVAVRIVFDGCPAAAKSFVINGFKRKTDENGCLRLGGLPLGYRLEIDVDGSLYSFVVESGKDTFVIDVTTYSRLLVKVLLDGNPCPDTPVTVEYSGVSENMLTHADGCVSKSLVRYPTPHKCSVSVLQETQSRPIDREQVEFLFQCKKPVVEPPVPPIPPVVPEPSALVHIWALLDGHPCPAATVSLLYDGKKEYLKTDESGCISKEVILSSRPSECVVEWEGESQSQVLDEKGAHFLLQKRTSVEPPVPQCSQVHIQTLLDGHPCPAATVSLLYDGKKEYLKTDESGCISKELILSSCPSECVVEWEGESQGQVLDEKGAHFVLQKRTPVEPPEPPARKMDWTWLGWLLLLLLLGMLVVVAYWVGGILLEQAIQEVVW